MALERPGIARYPPSIGEVVAPLYSAGGPNHWVATLESPTRPLAKGFLLGGTLFLETRSLHTHTVHAYRAARTPQIGSSQQHRVRSVSSIVCVADSCAASRALSQQHRMRCGPGDRTRATLVRRGAAPTLFGVSPRRLPHSLAGLPRRSRQPVKPRRWRSSPCASPSSASCA